MRIRTRMLLRDMLKAKGRVLATLILIMIGVNSYMGFAQSADNLESSYDTIYDDLNMCDANIYTEPMDPGDIDILLNTTFSDPDLNEVVDALDSAVIEPRLVMEGKADIGGSSNAKAIVMGIPGDRHPKVNDILVEKGEYFSSSNSSELLVERAFAGYNGLELGDEVHLMIGTYSGIIHLNMTIDGLVVSPEYLLSIGNPEFMFPIRGSMGTFYLSLEYLQYITGMGPMVNCFSVLFDGELPPAHADRRSDP